MTRPAPPSGTPPPERSEIEGFGTVELRPLAVESWRRYQAEFPDELGRYGPAGEAWYVHDTIWLLSWAALELKHGEGILTSNLSWLVEILAARDFPLERLTRSLEISAEVVTGQLGPQAEDLGRTLLGGAGQVRELQGDREK